VALIRGLTFYLDNNVWQTISADEEFLQNLGELVKCSAITLAISDMNILELPLRATRKQTMIRTRTAYAMLRLASRNHFVAERKLLSMQELKALSERRRGPYAFLKPRCEYVSRLWEFLQGCVEQVPSDPRLIGDIRDDRDKQKAGLVAKWQTAIDRASARDGSIRRWPATTSPEVVERRHPEMCREAIEEEPAGKKVLDRMTLAEAVSELQGIRVFHKAGLFLLLDRSRRGKRIEEGDPYDVWHVTCGSYADIFVTAERKLKGLVHGLAETSFACLSYEEFEKEVKDLHSRCC